MQFTQETVFRASTKLRLLKIKSNHVTKNKVASPVNYEPIKLRQGYQMEKTVLLLIANYNKT